MMMSPQKPSDPYAVLGIARDAEQGEIKRAYFQLVRKYTPEQAPEKFQEIRAAYDKLKTPERRAQADLFLLQPPPETPNRRRPSYDVTVHDEDIIVLAREIAIAQMEVRRDFHEPDIPE